MWSAQRVPTAGNLFSRPGAATSLLLLLVIVAVVIVVVLQ